MGDLQIQIIAKLLFDTLSFKAQISRSFSLGSVERLSVEIMCTSENCQNINGECSVDVTGSHVNIQT